MNIDIIEKLCSKSKTDMFKNLDFISSFFLGYGYTFMPIGDGIDSEIIKKPIFNIKEFDCYSYVISILSIHFGENFDSFRNIYIDLNYKFSEISFETRNHFTNIDFNLSAIKNGYIKDITPNLIDYNYENLSKEIKTLIDVPNWFITFGCNYFKEKKDLLFKLSESKEKKISTMNIIPFKKIINMKFFELEFLNKQLPEIFIIELVNSNSNLYDKIGTNLDVFHMGFGVCKDNDIIFRHASYYSKKVEDVNLIEYINKFNNNIDSYGLSIFEISDYLSH